MEDPEAKLNAIVGSAIRGLVESGASDESVGAFAHSHRSKVAQVLGIERKPDVTVDLQTVISAAVATALQQAGLAQGGGAFGQNNRVNVVVNGQRTSLTLDRQLLDNLMAKSGKQVTGDLIASFANNAPKGTKNRSKWVQRQLVAHLALQTADMQSLSQH